MVAYSINGNSMMQIIANKDFLGQYIVYVLDKESKPMRK